GVRRRRPPPPHGARLRPRPARAGRGPGAAARARDPRALGGLQPGLGLPRAGDRRGARPLLGRHHRRGRPGRLADPDAARPPADRPAGQQGRLPGPLRRARQGLDRPRRGALAGPLLGRRRRHGRVADAADRRRRGAGRLLLRRPARAGPRLPGRVRRARRVPAGRLRVGRLPGGRRPPLPVPAPRPAPRRGGRAPWQLV
ncbi:MAG: Nitroreductase family protein, partial [uncultured Blastococcus sp.]